MNLLESALQILELGSHLIAIARDIEDRLPTDKQACAADIWHEISRIAAEQAAKPSIDGVSLHE